MKSHFEYAGRVLKINLYIFCMLCFPFNITDSFLLIRGISTDTEDKMKLACVDRLQHSSNNETTLTECRALIQARKDPKNELQMSPSPADFTS